MKKKLALVLSVLLSVSMLAGCGNSTLAGKDLSQYVTLGEYKGIEVTVPGIEPAEAEVNELAEYFYQTLATEDNGAITDRPVKVGDTVNIDYEGKLNGVAFDGGTATGSSLKIGSGSFIDGFEDGLVGVNPGETVDLNLTFPKSYHAEDLAGQKVVFTVTVNFITPGVEEMNDKVIENFGSSLFSNVDELKEYCKGRLERQKQQEYETNVQAAVMDAVVYNATVISLPEKDIEASKERINATYATYAQSYGMTVEEFIYDVTGRDIASMAEEYTAQTYVFQSIANAEGLNLTKEEYERSLSADAAEAKLSEKDFLKKVGKEEYQRNLLTKKVLAYLVENAVITTE